jgi:1-pyrroline-4-hydroxy-2-carboxylate deaminase
MDRHDVDWRGYWPAVPAGLDPDEQRAVLERHVADGVHGMLVAGPGAAAAIAFLEGMMPVVVEVGAATDLGRAAMDAGASGLVVTAAGASAVSAALPGVPLVASGADPASSERLAALDGVVALDEPRGLDETIRRVGDRLHVFSTGTTTHGLSGTIDRDPVVGPEGAWSWEARWSAGA